MSKAGWTFLRVTLEPIGRCDYCPEPAYLAHMRAMGEVRRSCVNHASALAREAFVERGGSERAPVA